MPATVTLQVQHPDGTTKAFALTEHDTFLLGRMKDCHLCLPDDTQVSRHHFLLEACPPQASLRDLGSMNGTHINGKKYGGREKGETPEQGAKRQYPSIDLKHGDRITVGQSCIEVRIEAAPAASGVRQVDAALQEGDLSGLSPEAMQQLIFGKPGEAAFQLKGYQIHHELGRGGCGAVYLANPQRAPQEKVAVKIMLSRAQADTRAVDQFKREMAVIAKLQHPHIVRFLDSGSDEGTFFFVMEYCDGGSLADVARSHGGTLPWETLRPWALQALEGLAAAHKEGFVHRDLKPHNILIQQGRAKVADFGLAKNFQKAGLSGMSLTGNYAGTPLFMPPEQIVNFKYVKPVSDVWSFAATLYHLLTGKFPYRFDPKRDPIDIILNENPVPIRDRLPSLAKEIATTIDKSLVRNPKDRFPDAGKLLASLAKP
jgi:pSer/pThr/pTyr-binding forkhead associated (FHA) protein/predicted Ser/Thr protein kinase